MSRPQKSAYKLFVILLTFALSSLSATIVYPILAPLFLGESGTIIRSNVPESIRSILFGIFLASFPLAQFLFAPLIGDYSDRSGRRKSFLITLALEVVGYIFSAIGIEYRHLSFLFLGRFITGLGAANFAVCLATLSDISEDPKTRSRYYSFGSAVAGVMFVLGPFIGGRLSDHSISPYFNFAFPMWIGALFAGINTFLILFTFKESRFLKKEGKVDPIKAVHDLERAFQKESITTIYIIFFFFLFGWNMLYQFLPAMLVEQFQASSSLIGDLTALMGMIWFAGTILISLLLRYFPYQKWVLIFSLLFFGITTFLIPLPNKISFFIAIAAVAVFLAGGVWPILVGAISKSTDSRSQGKNLGVSQSIQSLAMLLAPFFGGFFLQSNNMVPFIFASGSALISIYFLTKTKTTFFNM